MRLLLLLSLTLVCQLSAGEQRFAQLAIGDWVFRQGTSLESHLIASFGQGRFSHIGVIVRQEPQIQILHATTNDNARLPNQVILSSWDEFTSAELARSYAVARPLFLDREQQNRIARLLLEQLGQKFVLAAQDKPHLYCTTIIADAISAVQPDFAPLWSFLDQPLVRGYYLHPDAFAAQQLSWLVSDQTNVASASHTRPQPAPESHRPRQ